MAANNPITQGDGTGGTLAMDELTANGATAKRQWVATVYTSITSGRKTVATAGTREQLAASTAARRVEITAETDNTGVVVVGGSTVVAALASRAGTPLNPGDTITVEIDDLAKIYMDVTVNGDGVTYNNFN